MSNPTSTAALFWPFFDLEVRTPRLTLRYPDDERSASLMDLAATVGVHEPDYMPFSVPWTRFDPPYLQQQGMQHQWRMRAGLEPASWDLPFAVYEDGRLVGVQSVGAKSFLVTRTVGTGSWIAKPEQGRGIGKEMRAAILHLAFAGLGAERAVTSAFADNTRSIGVTKALGYVDNGWDVDDREGQAVRHLRYLLEAADWQTRRRDDIEIHGLEPCLPVLGLPAPQAR
jgi:RimJ/RimL family protein N-acetyltransferase